MRTIGTSFHMTTAEATATAKATFTPRATIQRSPWHSPVLYLFGGLAAMLGLIAFALLMLACSYWKLSHQANGGDDGGERDVEGGGAEKGDGGTDAKTGKIFEEKFLVIMAGEVKPTFLATHVSINYNEKEESKMNLGNQIKENNGSELRVSQEQSL